MAKKKNGFKSLMFDLSVIDIEPEKYSETIKILRKHNIDKIL
jgi:fructose/tagatose bisphosphate aldolase